MRGQKYYEMVPPGADLSHISENLRALAVPASALEPDPKNARKHPARNLAIIRASFKRYGQRQVLAINLRTGRPKTEAGAGRLQVARELAKTDPRWAHIAVIFEDDDPVTAMGYALADNRAADTAEWDEEILAAQAQELLEAGEDLEAIGLDAEDQAALLGGGEPLQVQEWDFSATGDRFVLTVTGPLPLQAEVRGRLKGLPEEVQVEISTVQA